MNEQDEEATVQHLLGLLPKTEDFSWVAGDRFDPRGATDRIGLLALASLDPMSFDDGTELDLAAILDELGSEAFFPLDTTEKQMKGSIGGRLVHPPRRGLRAKIAAIVSTGDAWPGSLESHALDGPTLDHLVAGRIEDFLALRERRIALIAERLVERQCRWGYGDRPSISRYLHEASE